MQAFVPCAPLQHRPPLHRRTVATCSTAPPHPDHHPHTQTRRRAPFPARLFGAVAGAMLVFMPAVNVHAKGNGDGGATTTTTTSAKKNLRYDGRQELDSGEKAMSLTLTAGTFAVLAVWAWKQNRRDDELENIRIKEEVERLEKLKAEFVDVEEDDGGLDDEDLLASLKQRIGEEEGGEGQEDDQSEGEEGSDEQKKEGDTDDETGTDSVDMLKRMWDATDDDKDKDVKKS